MKFGRGRTKTNEGSIVWLLNLQVNVKSGKMGISSNFFISSDRFVIDLAFHFVGVEGTLLLNYRLLWYLFYMLVGDEARLVFLLPFLFHPVFIHEVFTLGEWCLWHLLVGKSMVHRFLPIEVLALVSVYLWAFWFPKSEFVVFGQRLYSFKRSSSFFSNYKFMVEVQSVA